MRAYGLAVLITLSVANVVGYAARNALFAVLDELGQRFSIDDGDLGLLGTIFMLPHAVGTVLFGWAGDRFERRRVIAAGLAVAGSAGLLGAVASDYWSFAASRAVVGFGTAAIVPVANTILGAVFEGAAKASWIAVFNLGLFVGGVVGYGLGAAVGFPIVVIAIAIGSLIVALTVLALPVQPAAASPVRLIVALTTLARDGRRLFAIATLRWVIVSTTMMAFAAGGLNAWLQAFLVRPVSDGGKGMSEQAATMLLGLALLGGLSGIVVGAQLADRLRSRFATGRMWTIVGGMALTAPCAAAAIELPAGPALYAVGVATLFFISWYHAPMAATVDDLAPPALAVSAQALVIATMHLVGTAPAMWIVGEVSEHTDLATALWVPTAALVVAALCMALATRTFAADATRARGAAAAHSL